MLELANASQFTRVLTGTYRVHTAAIVVTQTQLQYVQIQIRLVVCLGFKPRSHEPRTLEIGFYYTIYMMSWYHEASTSTNSNHIILYTNL